MILHKAHTQFNEFFNSKEFDSPDVQFSGNNIDIRVIEMLYVIRLYLESPINISSGVRTINHNKKIGGVNNSSHVLNNAIDIIIIDNDYRYRLLKILFELGITRIGIYKTHIHIDVDLLKHQYICWYK